jgi:hypothetical protein
MAVLLLDALPVASVCICGEGLRRAWAAARWGGWGGGRGERDSKFDCRTYLIASGMEIEIFQLRIR